MSNRLRCNTVLWHRLVHKWDVLYTCKLGCTRTMTGIDWPACVRIEGVLFSRKDLLVLLMKASHYRVVCVNLHHFNTSII